MPGGASSGRCMHADPLPPLLPPSLIRLPLCRVHPSTAALPGGVLGRRVQAAPRGRRHPAVKPRSSGRRAAADERPARVAPCDGARQNLPASCRHSSVIRALHTASHWQPARAAAGKWGSRRRSGWLAVGGHLHACAGRDAARVCESRRQAPIHSLDHPDALAHGPSPAHALNRAVSKGGSSAATAPPACFWLSPRPQAPLSPPPTPRQPPWAPLRRAAAQAPHRRRRLCQLHRRRPFSSHRRRRCRATGRSATCSWPLRAATALPARSSRRRRCRCRPACFSRFWCIRRMRPSCGAWTAARTAWCWRATAAGGWRARWSTRPVSMCVDGRGKGT